MKKTIHRADSRGYANHGWLEARHSFSFAGYYDSSRVHFGMLRVLNDDIVVPSMGFGMHPHDNMEIVTIPISGSLQHKDNTGSSGIITAGEIQVMSAGTGVFHSEMNPSATEPVNLLQIWVFPKEKDIAPRYDQKSFPEEGRKNTFQTLVSPDPNDDALWINQDAWFSMADLSDGSKLEYRRHKEGNGMYCFLIEGEVQVAGETIGRRDAIGISDCEALIFQACGQSKLVVIEIPMN